MPSQERQDSLAVDRDRRFLASGRVDRFTR